MRLAGTPAGSWGARIASLRFGRIAAQVAERHPGEARLARIASGIGCLPGAMSGGQRFTGLVSRQIDALFGRTRPHRAADQYLAGW